MIAAVLLLIIPKAAESITTLAAGFDGYIAGLTSWAASVWDRIDLAAEAEEIIRDFGQDILTHMKTTSALRRREYCASRSALCPSRWICCWRW